ncbi:nuclear factor Y subunit C11 [Euphorbia peplus]|nr:nuclear factor Y subunit C11 [Euphorbia peplus]
MRKKLDTRFPAARIKKIMQADEDVGKIALAVPVLVSKALELFLQDLCDRTYEITLQRGAKTMSALHLKHCVQNYNVFDFLREIVSRVPDYGHGHGHADGAADHKTLQKRKPNGDECNDSDEESKRSRTHDTSHPGGSTRGRGRGRRGRGRGSRTVERETSYREVEFEPSTTPQQCANPTMAEENGLEPKEEPVVNDTANVPERNFDLNAAVNETEDAKAAAAAAAAALAAPVPAVIPEVTASGPAVAESSSAAPATGANQEEYPGWSLSEMDKMAIDPLQLAQLGTTMDEEEEDYDEEG